MTEKYFTQVCDECGFVQSRCICESDPLLTPEKVRENNPYPDMIRADRTYGDARVWEDGVDYAQEYFEPIITDLKAQLLKVKRPDREAVAKVIYSDWAIGSVPWEATLEGEKIPWLKTADQIIALNVERGTN